MLQNGRASFASTIAAGLNVGGVPFGDSTLNRSSYGTHIAEVDWNECCNQHSPRCRQDNPDQQEGYRAGALRLNLHSSKRLTCPLFEQYEHLMCQSASDGPFPSHFGQVATGTSLMNKPAATRLNTRPAKKVMPRPKGRGLDGSRIIQGASGQLRIGAISLGGFSRSALRIPTRPFPLHLRHFLRLPIKTPLGPGLGRSRCSIHQSLTSMHVWPLAMQLGHSDLMINPAVSPTPIKKTSDPTRSGIAQDCVRWPIIQILGSLPDPYGLGRRERVSQCHEEE